MRSFPPNAKVISRPARDPEPHQQPEPTPPPPPLPSPFETVAKEMAAANQRLADTISKAILEATERVSPPTVQVEVPARPAKWTFAIERDKAGLIKTITATAIE